MAGQQFALGELLAQIRPSGTTAVTAYTAVLRTEITLMLAVVTGAGSIDIEVFHDDDGTTYDDTTMIGNLNKAKAGDDLQFQAQSPGSGIMVKIGGSIGIRTGTANELTVSIYGITESLAERVSTRLT